MRIIEPSFEILDRREMSLLQKIESAARLAYKSEEKITETSAGPMVKKLADSGHYPTLEFAQMHYFIRICDRDDDIALQVFQANLDAFLTSIFYVNKYIQVSVVDCEIGTGVIVSGTYRAMVEALMKTCIFGSDEKCFSLFTGMILMRMSEDKDIPFEMKDTKIVTASEENDILYFVCNQILPDEICALITEPEEQELHLMCAVKFIVNRAVGNELVRHRPISVIQESQRFCRYSNEKFGREVTFILPNAFPIFRQALNFEDPTEPSNIWIKAMEHCEKAYMDLLDQGASPQAARTVLPNSCKTEIIIFTTIAEWRWIFKLRTSDNAEPSMRQIMEPLEEEFFKNQHLWE